MITTKLIILSVAGLLSSSLAAQETLQNLEELKTLQEKVKAVVNKNLGVTVSIMTPKGASGSGVIINKSGLILTAAHVIQGSKQVDIIFPNGKTEKANVLGANYTRDSGMCQMVKAGPWKFAPMADSKDLKVGDFVVAMGHAGGYDALRTPPVRFGRVLSKNAQNFVTTDCTLIGGDSGGPLYDLKGRVVGIHSNIGNVWSANNHAGTSGFKKDWQRLIKGDQWGTLGGNPMADPDSPAIGIRIGRPKDGGVQIDSVLANGPAQKSGLKAGDIILKLAGKPVNSGRGLINQIMKNDAGATVKLLVKRKDKTLNIDLVLGRRKDMNNNFKRN